MLRVISKDGALIAYEKTGAGPAVILVDGALSYRGLWGGRPLAAELAREYTVFTYDRRGRGESADTRPYAVDREIEDIAALLQEAGGSACLYGASSGAVLALKAAGRLGAMRVAKLALYEPPFTFGEEAVHAFAEYARRVDDLLGAGRRGDAVAFFLSDMAPPEMIEEMRRSPEWQLLEAVAHTVAYDNAVMSAVSVPEEDARAAVVPTLVLDGGASPAFLHEAADALAAVMPNARRRTLEAQTHRVSPEALAPVLAAFFKG